ncbi:MAG: anaerobic glycerol-3-phosphate dehydrogenase subunit B [Solirubrobacterales bacterium]|nr:anaerobic glycerol-3-phosphate dehydrogenase subunit B [Solirubrobacterales bacterium]
MRRELHFDAVVIGAGTAGLTAGARLAEAGARVAVLTKGVGSTHLAPGTVDVLGYAPERVSEPGRALEDLVRSRVDHPYALVGRGCVVEALQWFGERVAAGPFPGYRYVGGLERNHLLPTAIGALRPSALIPETMAAGDCAAGGASAARVCVVGVRALRDFHPALCAANLERAGVEARSVELNLALDRADQNALGLARRFDDPGWRAWFCAELSPHLRGEERVGLPAMLGSTDPHGVWSDLGRRLGRPVFEIPTLPPSVPGMRLFEVLRSSLRAAGGRLILGAEVVGAERSGERVSSVQAHAAGEERRYLARWVVLATGGFASGAIELDSRWVTRERVLGLPVRGAPGADEPRFVSTYLDEQPLARAGVAVTGDLRAEGVENVLVAGAALPGAAAWREGSGEGIALATGFRAAEVVSEAEGARAGQPGRSEAVV